MASDLGEPGNPAPFPNFRPSRESIAALSFFWALAVVYSSRVDVLYITLSDEPVKESDEEKPRIIIDYSERGNIVGIEIIDAVDASRHMAQPSKVEYEVA